MNRLEILGVVKEFLSLVDGSGGGPAEDLERQLRRVLDRLALAYHHADAPSDDRDFPAPRVTRDDALRARIGQRFPDLGFYNVVLDVAGDVGGTEPGIGDAIDDLVDIASDLREVVTRWETTSEADALWHFRFLFESHWGAHLRSLQQYLHARAF